MSDPIIKTRVVIGLALEAQIVFLLCDDNVDMTIFASKSTTPKSECYFSFSIVLGNPEATNTSRNTLTINQPDPKFND